MNRPAPTRCPNCGHVEATTSCRFCMASKIILGPMLTHEQADAVLKDLNLRARNDGRGDLHLVPR